MCSAGSSVKAVQQDRLQVNQDNTTVHRVIPEVPRPDAWGLAAARVPLLRPCCPPEACLSCWRPDRWTADRRWAPLRALEVRAPSNLVPASAPCGRLPGCPHLPPLPGLPPRAAPAATMTGSAQERNHALTECIQLAPARGRATWLGDALQRCS